MIRWCFLMLLGLPLVAADSNTTLTHRVEVVVTVAGMQESAEAIEQTAREIAALSERLSTKRDFTESDRHVIAELSRALSRNAEAVNAVAHALPSELDRVQNGASALLDQATESAARIAAASKREIVDPTLDRIRNQVLLFLLLTGGILAGVVWYALRQIRSIAATGSQTVGNIQKTMASLEKVVEKVNRADDGWSSY